MKRIVSFTVVVIAVVGIGSVIYSRLTAIPIRSLAIGWTAKSWSSHGPDVKPDVAIRRMICRARIDQFVRPIPRTHRILGVLVAVRQGTSNETYLAFGESLPMHRFVVYSYSPAEGKLHWKAVDSYSP